MGPIPPILITKICCFLWHVHTRIRKKGAVPVGKGKGEGGTGGRHSMRRGERDVLLLCVFVQVCVCLCQWLAFKRRPLRRRVRAAFRRLARGSVRPRRPMQQDLPQVHPRRSCRGRSPPHNPGFLTVIFFPVPLVRMDRAHTRGNPAKSRAHHWARIIDGCVGHGQLQVKTIARLRSARIGRGRAGDIGGTATVVSQ